MAPFTGPISGAIQALANGSIGALVTGMQALGSAQDAAYGSAAYAYMPGWLLAASVSNVGL